MLATSDGVLLGVSMCPSTITVSHLASGGVAPVDKTVTYGVVTTAITGTYKCWITQNLGADHQAVSSADATEASAGWYWQFNRKQGYKHDGSSRTPNSAWVYPLSESSTWLPENDPCTIELGAGWRIPTYEEWVNAFFPPTGWPTPLDTYSSPLKMHKAGYLSWGAANLSYRGTRVRYWGNFNASYGPYYEWAYSFYIDEWGVHGALHERSHGYPVRCIKD